MRTPKLAVLLAFALAWPEVGRATDAPHDASSGADCQSCHLLHNALGSSLTIDSTMFALCSRCHNDPQYGKGFGLPWNTNAQASPGAGGAHHSWTGSINSPSAGALPPTLPALKSYVTNGNLKCSTCHDPHGLPGTDPGYRSFAPDAQHVSLRVGAANAPLANPNGPRGTGTMTVATVTAAATAKGYLVEILTAAPAVTFRLSNDGGKSWWGWDGAAWVAGNASGRPIGANLALDDGTNALVTFSADPLAFKVGDQWRFYVSYPLLRATNVNGELCEDCHRPRRQSTADVEGSGAIAPNAGVMFSHPVGEKLHKSYDRVNLGTGVTAILDANGAVQGGAGADANPTNDLELDAAGNVRCTSCHAPHNADSNSLTVDPR